MQIDPKIASAPDFTTITLNESNFMVVYVPRIYQNLWEMFVTRGMLPATLILQDYTNYTAHLQV